MNSWLQSMKQWTQWLMGEAPLPDGRSKAMLAGTIATISAVAVAVPAVIPTSSSANAAAKRSVSAGQDSNSSQYTVPSSTVSPNGAIAAATTSTTSSGIYIPADPYAKPPKVKHLGKRPQGAAAGSGATTSGGATSLPQATPLIAGAGLLGASGGTSTGGVTSTGPVTTVPPAPTQSPLVPVDSIPALITPVTPPSTPLLTAAQSFVSSALLTWKAPPGSTATGYDVFVGLAPGQELPVPVNGAAPVTADSYLVTGLTTGQSYYFTVRSRAGTLSSSASNEVSAIPFDGYTPVGHLVGPVVSIASTADGTGYWLAAANGSVSAHGSAPTLSPSAPVTLTAPIRQIVADPRGNGYWEVAADGGVYTYGDAPFEGAASSVWLNSPIVDLVPTADGQGYFEVGADGGVFAYGDAVFAGSLGGTAQASPTVGMALDRATGGYWLVQANGVVTGFNAPHVGPQANDLPAEPVVGIAATSDGRGFWEVSRSGAVYAFGDAPFRGPYTPLHLAAPVTAIAADPSGSNGYWLVSADGGVYTYGTAFYGAG